MMDPLKRELYMRARTILEYDQKSCVCWSLMEALQELGFTDLGAIDPSISLDGLLRDLFPEFFGLDDLIQWHTASGMIYHLPRRAGTASHWWTGSGNAPRLRILDCILNSH